MTDVSFLSHLRSFVGQPAGADRLAVDEVNVPAIRRFAEAMGDANPVYSSEAAAVGSGRPGIVAPPATLPIWTMDGYRAALTAQAMTPDPSSGILAALAAEGFTTTPATNCRQEYARELRPGDRLLARGVVDGVSEEKGTALGPAHVVSLRWTFLDQRGDAVGVQTMRGVAFNPDGARRPHRRPDPDDGPDDDPGAGPARPVAGEAFEGQRLADLTIGLDRLAVAVCSAACNDFRAGHYDPDLARAIGMRDVFTDIPTSTAMTARYVTDWCGPAGRLRRVDVALGVPWCAGDTLRLKGRVAQVGLAGTVTVAVDGRTEHGHHIQATVDVELR
jgi:acyl dehydratase